MGYDVSKFTQTKVRSMPVVLLLDVSDSMNIVEGGDYVRTGRFEETDGHKVEIVTGNTITRIDYLNKSVNAMLKAFQEQATKQLPIQMGIITFGEKVEQVMPLTNVLEINSTEEFTGSGNTPLKEALETAKKLIEDKEQITSKDYRPCVVLVSDGEANPGWENTLEKFISDGRSAKCDRWAVSISKDADKNMLKKFVGNDEQLLEADESEKIAECFKLITMSVLIRSKSQNPNELVPMAKEDNAKSAAQLEQEARISNLFQI